MAHQFRLVIATLAFASTFLLQYLADNSYAQKFSPPESGGATVDAGVGDAYSAHILSLKTGSKLSSDEAKALLDVMEKARFLKMPHEPLNDKLDEGLAKRIPPKKVASVLDHKINDYGEVKSLLGQYKNNWSDTTRSELIGRLADCYGYGVTRSELSALIREAPASSLTSLSQGTEAYAALKQSGINPDSARNVVEATMRSERFADWSALASLSKLAAEHNIPKEKAMSAMMDSIGKFGDMRGVSTALGLGEHTDRQSTVKNRDTAPAATQGEGMPGDTALGRNADTKRTWSGGKSQSGESRGRSGEGSSGGSGGGGR